VHFLAEAYLAGKPRAAVRRTERVARRIAARGTPVRLVASIYVPADEMCLLVFEACSSDVVAEVGAEAELEFDRVLECS
jgi:hypothetical protein